MTTESLQKKTVHGAIWAGTENLANQLIGFTIGIFLARKLSPSDYGMVGMLSIFIAISQTIVDSGFSNALIRKIDRNDDDFSTAFYFNVVVGVILYLILFFCSPLIAIFFDTPLLTKLTRVVAIPLIINSLCIVQQAKLTIVLNFRIQAFISVAASVVSGVFGLYLAYHGYGVWALAYSVVASGVVRCALLWVLAKWHPTRVFSKSSFKNMFSYGSKLLASGILDTTFNNIYPVLIGYFYKSSVLGQYTRAQNYSNLPATTVTGLIYRVTFPVLCSVQEDNERLCRIYRQMIRFSGYVVFPLMIGLAVLAKPLVLYLITDKWLPCVPLLQITCLAMMWYPIHALNLNVLQVKGRSDLFLKLEIIKKILSVITIVVTLPFGIVALCWGMVFSSVICLFINTYYTSKLINVGVLRQMQDLLPVILYTVTMGAFVWFVTSFIDGSLYKIIVGFVSGVVYYLCISYLCRAQEFGYLKDILKNQVFSKEENG